MAASGQEDELAALRQEVERLRELVGPSEQSYVDLQQDLLAARDAAKGAEATAGMLRGQLAELHVELARARQDQDHLQRIVSSRLRLGAGRLSRALRARLF
jgi:predicted  nucleic acid-binding Zn-ribbon protein